MVLDMVLNTSAVGLADGAVQDTAGTPVTLKLSILIFGLDPVVPPDPL